HQLKDCVWPTQMGDIRGCPLCNTMEHHFDNCPTRQSISEADRRQQDFNLLVRDRGGLPPFRTTVAWPQLAISFDNAVLPAGYPATKDFARRQLQAGEDMFALYHLQKPLRLLNDPAITTIATVRQNLSALLETEVVKPRSQLYWGPTTTANNTNNNNTQASNETRRQLEETTKLLEEAMQEIAVKDHEMAEIRKALADTQQQLGQLYVKYQRVKAENRGIQGQGQG
ncbi:hypothetical protein C8A03DRAFT_18624, partial [Achaetomium macrosporum]